MEFTDFQKECLVKAKGHLNLIPKSDTGQIKWKFSPGKVAVIVDLWKQSKLSGTCFADQLKIDQSSLSKFSKGKFTTNEQWPELLALLKPEEAKEKEIKKAKEKADLAVEKEILTILNRDSVREIGLRTETITAEISSYPSRFVKTILGRLEKAGKIITFKSSDKFTKWAIVSKEKSIKLNNISESDSITKKVEEKVGLHILPATKHAMFHDNGICEFLPKEVETKNESKNLPDYQEKLVLNFKPENQNLVRKLTQLIKKLKEELHFESLQILFSHRLLSEQAKDIFTIKTSNHTFILDIYLDERNFWFKLPCKMNKYYGDFQELQNNNFVNDVLKFGDQVDQYLEIVINCAKLLKE